MTPVSMAREVLKRHGIKGISASSLAMAAAELHGVATYYSLNNVLRLLAEMRSGGQGMGPSYQTARVLREADVRLT